MKVFLDTNVLISSLTTRGLCSDLLQRTIADHELIVCNAVLKELERVLTEKFHLPQSLLVAYLHLLQEEATVVEAEKMPHLPKITDPDDIPIVACAIVAKANVFVTGDKALLDLGRIEDLPMLSPRQFWQDLLGLPR